MIYQSNQASQPWRTLMERLEKPLTGLFVTLGLVVAGSPNGLAQGSELTAAQLTTSSQAAASSIAQAEQSPASPNRESAQPLNGQSPRPTTRNAATNRSLADGVYLYGQSPQPEQLGAAYMVFEVTQGDVVGAFYMPRSSFDCFSGQFEANRLALSIVDSYEQTAYPFAIALDSNSPVAMAGGEAIAPVGLEGFQRIDQLSTNDQRILTTCKADHATRSTEN